jgi:fumarylacetoacetase
VSPWVITIEALEPFRVEAAIQNPSVLPYLQEKKRLNFDVQLEVILQAKGLEEMVISRSNFKNMYWTVAQQIAHHTVNGCNLNIGDLLGSGTISGKEPDSFGSLLEITWGGKNPIILPDETERRFLEDYDTIIIRGFAEKNDVRVDFGEVRTMVLPTK